MAEGHSEKFAQVKEWYDTERWGAGRVRNAVVKEWITAEEYEEITGEPYRAK